jgi:histone H3/H4
MSAKAKQVRKKEKPSPPPAPAPLKKIASKKAMAPPPPRVDPYCLPEAVVRKFLLRSKSKQISSSVHKPMNDVMRGYVREILKHAITFASLGNRSTLKPRDVQKSFEILGVEIY